MTHSHIRLDLFPSFKFFSPKYNFLPGFSYVSRWKVFSWGRRSSVPPQSGRWWPPPWRASGGAGSPGPRCEWSAAAWRSWAAGRSSAAAPPAGRGCSRSLPGSPRHTAGWPSSVQIPPWWAHSAARKKIQN